MSYPHRHSNSVRIIANERTFFVTSSTSGRRCFLQSDRSASLLIEILYHYRAAGKFRLHAFVVMPDHFHLLLTVNSGMTIERAVQLVKSGFACRAGRQLRLNGPIWQKGFFEIRVLDGTTFETHRNYIHNNPVRAQLVAHAEDHPYSSAREILNIDPEPVYLRQTLCGA
jgi:putative transposase